MTFRLKAILQGSVSEHDSVKSQGSGDGFLLDKLYEGEARRLSLVSSHTHKLYISHLLEELQQLLCSGGLWTERRTELQLHRTQKPRGCKKLRPNTDSIGRYLRVQVAHVNSSPDLINFGGVDISHEGGLGVN